MDKLVVLSFGNGSLVGGFPTVTAHVWERDNPHPMKFTGGLPAAPKVFTLCNRWRLLYIALYQRLDVQLRIEIETADVTNVSEIEFSDLCSQLVQQLNAWLNSDLFRSVEQRLRTHLNPADNIRVIIETDDNSLQRLPWHLWSFLEDYPGAEIALSACSYQRSTKEALPSSAAKIRILAVLGSAEGLEIAYDQACLKQLSGQAHIHFLIEPTVEELNEQLWQPWHILFFAGHSFSQEHGVLQLNQTDNLTLEQLQYALRRSIAQGLRLAIFNSCDGLGLARSLADLHIPQVIVMREPVPDRVAQKFLQCFLSAFFSGQSLYASVRTARESLQGLETQYPCATWLPIICQNPAEASATWEMWCAPKPVVASQSRPYRTLPRSRSTIQAFKKILVFSLLITLLSMGMRYVGLLQSWELSAFDQMMRLRPPEPPDSRLLIVAVTEEDLRLPVQTQRKGSLSDSALAQLLDKLIPLQPRAIGLDIYRDFSASSTQPELINQLRHNPAIFAICKASDQTINHAGIAPPPEIPLERQGFSDVLEDPDRVLRRQLLAMDTNPTSPCTTPYALSAQLAFHFLEAEGIPIRYTPNKQLQIGNVTFQRLQNYTGSYHNISTWGYQILINYRSSSQDGKVAPIVPLADVLSGKLKAADVRDRVILIGVTAPSAGDYFATPYSTGSVVDIPGVVAQAQMVSQIISAVKDKRALLTVWPLWREFFWIWSWAIIGGILAVRYGLSLRLFVRCSIALSALLILCLYLLIQGHWVPLIPAILVLIGTSSSLLIQWTSVHHNLSIQGDSLA